MDTDRLRAGVELDRHGAPIAYHIRQALPSDCFVYFPLGFADRGEISMAPIFLNLPTHASSG